MNRLLDPVAAPTSPQVKPSPNGAQRKRRPPAASPESSAEPTHAAPIGNTAMRVSEAKHRTDDAPTSLPSPQPATSGRSADEKFAKGNPGGPGNPFARQSAALRKRVQAKLTDEKLDKIVDTLIKEAEEGNVAAAKLLLSYAIGQPTPAADPDSLDLQEWKVLREQVKPAEVNEFLGTFPIDEACELLNVLKPIRSDQWKKPMRRMFVEEGWMSPDGRAVSPGGAPIAIGPNGAPAQTPRDRAAKRKKFKKKYAIKGGKLVKRSG